MSTVPRGFVTAEQYLAFERGSNEKHEYFRGELFAMAGASRAHNRIAANISAGLHQSFKGRPCEEFVGDMRVKVGPAGLYTYPDVIAICEEPRFEDAHLDTLLNPQVVFEVLSESTERYDRGRKFAEYRELESLTDYVLVAQDRISIEHFDRSDDGSWRMRDYRTTAEMLTIDAVDCQLKVADIYAKVQLENST